MKMKTIMSDRSSSYLLKLISLFCLMSLGNGNLVFSDEGIPKIKLNGKKPTLEEARRKTEYHKAKSKDDRDPQTRAMAVNMAVVAGGVTGLVVAGPAAAPVGAVLGGCVGLACSEGPGLYHRIKAKTWSNKTKALEAADRAKNPGNVVSNSAIVQAKEPAKELNKTAKTLNKTTLTIRGMRLLESAPAVPTHALPPYSEEVSPPPYEEPSLRPAKKQSEAPEH